MKPTTSFTISGLFLRNSAKLLAISTLLTTGTTLWSDELTWAAAGGGDWNTTEMNWSKGGQSCLYSDGTNVYFNDIVGVNSAVIDITETSGVAPNSIYFNNDETTYTLSGMLTSNSGAGINKQAIGKVNLYGNNNSFLGKIYFRKGTIQIQSNENLIGNMKNFVFEASSDETSNKEIRQMIGTGEDVLGKIGIARNSGALPTLIVDDEKNVTINNTSSVNQLIEVSSNTAGSIHLDARAKLSFTSASSGQSLNLGRDALLVLTASDDARYLFNNNDVVGIDARGAAIFSKGFMFVEQADFMNNQAIRGGALYSEANSLICNSMFLKNKVLGNSGNSGGAVYSIGEYVEFSNTDFIQNEAATDGGAIYFSGTNLKLNVASGQSATFAGNMANSLPNSIRLLNANLIINTESKGLLDMRDPMSVIVNAGTASSPVTRTILKTGPGVWKIAGTTQVNASSFSIFDFVVEGGTLSLYGQQTLSYTNSRLGLDISQDVDAGSLQISGGRFILKSGTILEVGGTSTAPNSIRADKGIEIKDGAIIRATAANTDAVLILNNGAWSTLSGVLNLAANGNETLTLGAKFQGSGGIEKTGAGKVILEDEHAYTGDISVASDGGELVIKGTLGSVASGGGGDYAGKIKISNGTRVTLEQTNDQVLSGVISSHSGSGTFAKVGSGALVLSGNNLTFEGKFELAGGALYIVSRLNLLQDFNKFKFTANALISGNAEIVSAIGNNDSQAVIRQLVSAARNAGDLPVLDIAENAGIIFDGSGADSQRLSIGNGKAGNVHLNMDAELTFQNNQISGEGGAIQISSSALLVLTATDGARYEFQNNIAHNGGGGAISNDGSLVLESVNFRLNQATNGNGGAIRTSTSTLSLADTDFISNLASGSGGAVFGYNSLITFANIEAEANAADKGGAIYSDKNLTVSGALFANNKADTAGGAIYSAGGVLILENVVFVGNKSGMGSAERPNSLYLENTVLQLQGAANIYFEDPIYSASGNTLFKTGTGIAQFAKENRLDTTNVVGSGATVAISDGELHLVDGARFDASGSVAGTFFVNTNGVLSGRGTFVAPGGGFIVSGTLSPDLLRYAVPNFNSTTNTFDSPPPAPTGSAVGRLEFEGNMHFNGTRFAIDVNGSSTLSGAERSDFIHLNGDVSVESGTKIRLVLNTSNASYGGTFVFMEKTAGNDFGYGDNIVFSDVLADRTFSITGKVDGYSLNARANAVVEPADNNGKALQIRFDALRSLDLTWTNETGNSRWSATPADLNWTNGLSGDELEKRYRDGDRVTFSDIGAGTVNIAQGGVSPGGVSFTNTLGHDYLINGDILAADAGVTIEKTGGGALILNGNVAPALTVGSGLVLLGAQAIVSTAHVKAGAMLAGDGGVARASFDPDAILAPGTDGTIGTLFLGEYDGTTHLDGIILKNDIDASSVSDLLHITGNARFGFIPNTLDINDGSTDILWGAGRYSILSVVDEGATLEVGDLSQTLFRYKGIAISGINSRLKATVEKTTDSAGQHLVLRTYADSSLVLTWIGRAPGIGTWDTVLDNWRQDSPQREIFRHGDVVIFDAALALSESVTLNVGIVPEGVIAGSMLVKGTGGTFVFTGGPLIGVATQTSGYALSAADGRLSIEAGTSAFFQNNLEFDDIAIAGHATFAGEVNLKGGHALSVSSGGVATVLDDALFAGVAQVTNDGALIFDLTRVDTAFDYAGRITGSGIVEKTGAGLLTLSGNNAHGGGTIVRAGVLAIANDDNLGSGINTLDGGTLRLLGDQNALYAKPWVLGVAGGIVENAGSVTLGGGLSGPGSLTKRGPGELTLVGGGTYEGDTTISAGTLKVTGTLSSGTSAEAYSGNILVGDGAHLEFAQNERQSLGGVLAGAGSVAKTGMGVLLFAGANAHNIGSFDNHAGSVEVGILSAVEIHNYAEAHFVAEEVHANIRNEGMFSAVRTTGDIVNTGTLTLNASLTQWNGALHNNGGLVDFVNAGRRLEVRTLHADTATVGLVRMDIDLVTPGNSDIFVVSGEISGKHRLLLSNITPGNQSHLITRESGEAVTVIQATSNVYDTNEDVSGVLDGGLYRFSVTEDGLGGYNLARVDSYGSTGQSAVNAAGAMALNWFSMQDNLTKRMGELRMAEWAARVGRQKAAEERAEYERRRSKEPAPVQPANEQADEALLNSTFWVRAFGERVETHLGIPGIGAFSEYQYGANLGYDINFLLNKDCRTFLGVVVGYHGARRNFYDGFGSDGKTEAVSVGLYGTVVHANGWYLDGTFRGQTAEVEYDAIEDHGEFTNRAFGASIETGWHFTLQPSREGVPVSFWQDWFVEPGFQFAYSHVFADTYTTDHGVHVRGGDSDIFRLLAGLRFGRTIYTREYGEIQPYGRVGLEYQESLGGSIRVESERFVPTTDGVRAVIGVGVTWQLDESQQAHLEYEAAFGEKYDRPWGVTLSFRKRF